jgi:hypothetical protein
MVHIGTTRFNNLTFLENHNYRCEENIDGCIYGLSVAMPGKVRRAELVYVIEMNIESKKIMGIGRVPNFRYLDHPYRIYSERGYNRFIYKGTRRIPTDAIENKEVLDILYNILFKGKGHMCRGQGITRLNTEKLKENKKKVIAFLKALFQ